MNDTVYAAVASHLPRGGRLVQTADLLAELPPDLLLQLAVLLAIHGQVVHKVDHLGWSIMIKLDQV